MIITIHNYKPHRADIGAKAYRLFEMREHGLNVPELVCVTCPADIESLPASFGREGLYSVRSSASCEDGAELSFAGQFETFLNVPGSRLKEYVSRCLSSAGSSAEYIGSMNARTGKVAVCAVIQRMISAELSGVMFTSNPQGLLNEAVIAVGEGTGNNVVEDKTDVTHYYYNLSDDICCFERQNSSPLLTDGQIKERISISRAVCAIYGERQDIEFAIKYGAVYVLQSRPITTIKPGEITVLDSSNISESYPGISSPLTVSFVKEVYYRVFSRCVRRITRDDGTAERIDGTLRLMTDSVNGRVYYRISSWYDVILLLPFSRRIIPVWQEMLGVGDKTVTHGEKAPLSTRLRVAMSFFTLLFSNKRHMKRLSAEFERISAEFARSIEETNDPAELVRLYKSLRETLSDRWDLTLVNDMYTFIYTGLLKKSLSRRHGAEQAGKLANICISGNSEIESMRPLRLLSRIKRALEAENALAELSAVSTHDDMQRLLQAHPAAAKLIDEYLDQYGDRCPEELKLETLTYRLAPQLLKDNILSAADPHETSPSGRGRLHGLTRLFAANAAAGIRMRESSRLSRGRIFSLVREIVLKLADTLQSSGCIGDTRDVFFLTLDELFTAAVRPADLRAIVSERRQKYENYGRLPLYSRLIFAGKPFDKHLCGAHVRAGSASVGLRGIPCSDGIAEGIVMKVYKPTPDLDASGRIIAAKMTDPGWVFLITKAAGLISERGSLLSHTAIISRELGKPAVVGVKSLFSELNDGDRVRINGATGEIQVICPAGTV